MAKENLMGKTLPEFEQLFTELGEKAYHGRQLFKWIYHNGGSEFALMSDLSKELRKKLEDRFFIKLPRIEQTRKSVDGVEKFLFRLDDGNPVETVLIPDGDRLTVCISSQSGCALGCQFCATGTMGLLGDLTVGEILGQLLSLRESHGPRAFTNVVFMGMGEPLDNFKNLLESLKIMTDPLGLQISPRKITVSTSGVTPKIIRLADSGLKIRLAVSLHAATQKKRAQIMPIADTFGLENLMAAVRYFTAKNGDRVTFEYILFDGFNDSMKDVNALVKLMSGVPCKINILAYNPVPGLLFERPTDEKVDWFARQLSKRGPTVTVRQSRGADIDAACGQLAARDTAKGVQQPQ